MVLQGIKRGDGVKTLLKTFFLHIQLGRFLIKSLSLLNTVEGVIHLGVALISGWSLVRLEVYDFGAWLATLENTVFGVFSVVTGYLLGMKHHHH